MNNHVCKLCHAMKLKKLGVKQESIFWWIDKLTCDYEWDKWFIVNTETKNELIEAYESTNAPLEYYSAFLPSELGDMLPEIQSINEVNYWLWCGKMNNQWEVSYLSALDDKAFKNFEADSEANARAKMLEFLIENKLMEKE